MRALKALAPLLLMLSAPAEANLLAEMSFQQKWDAAEIVVLARAETSNSEARVVALRLVSTQKGAPPQTIVLRTRGRTSEDSLTCCEVGTTYLMFLHRSRRGEGFESVNGPHAVIRVGPAMQQRIETLEDPLLAR